jgi:hypothetical protein
MPIRLRSSCKSLIGLWAGWDGFAAASLIDKIKALGFLLDE